MNMLLGRKWLAGLSLCAATALIATNHAQAQSTAAGAGSGNDDQELTTLQKLVVTGSNIPMAADALAVPVHVMGPQEIAHTGVATNVLDVLRKAMPQFSGNGNLGSENANIGSGTTLGGSSLSLHNLTTLVLINGRRVAFSPATAQGGNEFVDVNMIPLGAIQRIETLSDGASAIYGSDAVSGVVNIILKSDYQGFEVGGHYGVSDNDGHYSERSAYLIGGVSNGKTSITVSAQYSQEDPIWQNQRGFSADQSGKTTYFPGVIDVYDFATGEDPYYMLKPGLDAPPGGGTYTVEQLVDQGIYVPASLDEVAGSFNLARFVTLKMEQKRRSVFASLDHQILDQDRLTLFGDLIYSNTVSQSQLAGQPIYPFVSTPYIDYALTGQSPSPSAGIGTGYVLASVPTNPFSSDWIDQGQGTNPDNFDYSSGKWVLVHNRFTDHPRVYNNDATLIRGVVGLRGRINEDYSWEIGGNLNRFTLDYHNPGVINVNAFTAAMNNGTINPFARTQAAGAITNDIIGSAQASFLSTLNEIDAKITGRTFDLPAGRLSFAIGGQYTRESLEAVPDVLSIPDANNNIGWAGATSFSPFKANRTIDAGFVEVQVPLISAGMAVPAVQSLDLDVAGRIERYSDTGTARVPKFSLRYQPIEDLVLRGTIGQSFTAPQLFYVYGPVSSGFTDSLTFPNYGGGTTENVQFQSRSGSNPNLEPAKARTWTAGFVYTPKQVKGLEASFDFFEINETGVLGNFDPQVVAKDVELNGAASPYAQYVHIGGWDGANPTAPGQLSSTAAANVYLDLPIINLAGQKVRGFDAHLGYAMNTSSAGRFKFDSTLVVYNSYRVQALPTERYFQYSGYATEGGSGSNGTVPKWRTYTTVDWSFHDFDVVLAHTYIPTVQDIGPGGSAAFAPTEVDSYSSFDLAASYNVNTSWLKDMKVTVGVTNVFNEMAPLAPNAFTDANADIGTYGSVGRFFYVDASYKF